MSLDVRLYECEYCGKSYLRPESRNAHEGNAHYDADSYPDDNGR